MQLLHSIIIGLVQGVTELLPVSATGHVTLVPYILGWAQPAPAVLVAMLLGTLVAILFVFGVRMRQMFTDDVGRSTVFLLIVGALPAAVIGLALNTVLRRVFGGPVATSSMIGLTGYFLFSGERWGSEHEERVREQRVVAARASARGEPAPEVSPLREGHQATPSDAVLAGAGQGLGFVPGLSHVGGTVAAALRVGLNRETALRYAFFLTAPSLVIAIVAELPRVHSAQPLSMIGAFVTSAVGGVLGIRWFTAVFTKRGLKPFGMYCFAMMIVGLLSALARG